jgi:hypothetical protein
MLIPHARTALAALLIAAGLAACAEPGVVPRPPALQQTASNMRDWDAAAVRLVDSMAHEGFIPAPTPPPLGRTPFPTPYYINVMAQGSTFLEVVRQSIERELLMRNLPVARSPDGATVLNLTVDVVHWGSSIPYSGGALTAIGLAGAAGTAIAAAGPITATSAAVLGAGALAATDVGLSVMPDSRTELVWRASIFAGDRVMMKGAEVLYVSADDAPLYLGSGALPPLTSPGVGLLGPARLLLYAR